MKPLNTSRAFAVYHDRSVYHIACLAQSDKGFDKTLCNTPLTSNKGVNAWDEYYGGYPAPIVVERPPKNKRLCKYCKSKLDAEKRK